ncbi:MAG TPA: amino acid ABC transporter substrate-binding protein [Gemmatimonadaceae bacterium]|jgi:general L-amino acid transport system substrate-binding protein
MIRRLAGATLVIVAVACTGSSTNGSRAGSATLSRIRARGSVKCGITQGAGFATSDSRGQWQGFDVDFCRAVAAAVLNDPAKVTFIPYTQQQRFAGLQSGEVDLLANGTSLTISRVMQRHLHFGPVYFYDGQGFMVPRSSGVTSATRLDGATICVQQGTTTESNLADFARRHAITFHPIVIEDLRGVVSALAGGRCDAISQDGAGLATTRTMLQRPGDYVILPDRISKEPIAAVLRSGDDQWLEVVNWVFRTPMQAEELGIDQRKAKDSLQSSDPTVRRFLGLEPGVVNGFGLDPRWTYNVIAAVGNYADIFDRNLGMNTPLRLERGMNRLWSNGGLMYSPPFR